MEICVNDISKTVEIWLTGSESADTGLCADLMPLCFGYKCQKYVVAVFESGGGNLFENTRNLLLHNRGCHEKLQNDSVHVS